MRLKFSGHFLIAKYLYHKSDDVVNKCKARGDFFDDLKTKSYQFRPENNLLGGCLLFVYVQDVPGSSPPLGGAPKHRETGQIYGAKAESAFPLHTVLCFSGTVFSRHVYHLPLSEYCYLVLDVEQIRTFGVPFAPDPTS